MATKGRISLALGKNIPTAIDSESNAQISFERVYLEQLATRARGVPPGELLDVYLRGAGSSIEMAVDGTTPASFAYEVPAGKHAAIADFSVLMADAAIDSFWSSFGGIAALALGLTAVVDSGGASPQTLLDLTDGQPWKRTADLLPLAGLVERFDSGAGIDVIALRLSLGDGLYLTAGQRMVVTVRDNLSGLDALRIRVHGIIRSSDAV